MSDKLFRLIFTLDIFLYIVITNKWENNFRVSVTSELGEFTSTDLNSRFMHEKTMIVRTGQLRYWSRVTKLQT